MADYLKDSLVYEKVWTSITPVINQSSRRIVIVSYITSESLIKFKKEDVLICDASPRAISSGQTTAELLNILYNLGVTIFSCPKLHSKVIVLDKSTIVGSANISKESTFKFETVLISQSNKIRQSAISMAAKLKKKSDQLDQKLINKLLKIPVIRDGFPVFSIKRKKSLFDMLKENDAQLNDYVVSFAENGRHSISDNVIKKEAPKHQITLPNDENWESYEQDYNQSISREQLEILDKKKMRIIELLFTYKKKKLKFESLTPYTFAFNGQFEHKNKLITTLFIVHEPSIAFERDSKKICSLLNKWIGNDPVRSKKLWDRSDRYLKPGDLKQYILSA